MKKAIFLLIGILNAISFYGYTYRLDSVWGNYAGDKMIRIMRYGCEYDSVYIDIYNPQRERVGISEFYYSKGGNRLAITNKALVGEDYNKTTQYIFEYDMLGNLLSKWSGAPEFYERDTFMYDENHRKINHTYYRYSNNQWIINSKSEYSYEVENNLVKSMTEIQNDKTIIKTTYTYDEDGRLLCSDDGSYRFVYQYYPDSVIQLFDRKENTEWLPLYKEVWKYNDFGQSYYTLSCTYKDNDYINEYRNFFEYDSNHNKVGSSREYWVENKWEIAPDWTTSYSYDNTLSIDDVAGAKTFLLYGSQNQFDGSIHTNIFNMINYIDDRSGQETLYYSPISPSGTETPKADMSIFVENGFVKSNYDFRIYTINGFDATSSNGNLHGIYIVSTQQGSQSIYIP